MRAVRQEGNEKGLETTFFFFRMRFLYLPSLNTFGVSIILKIKKIELYSPLFQDGIEWVIKTCNSKKK
jgi:hypothetical protein